MKKLIISTLIAFTLVGQVGFAEQIKTPAKNIETNAKPVFTDLPKDFWAKNSIEKLVKENIISGYGDGTVRPNASITRAEFVVMINKMMGYKDKVKTTKFKDVYKNQWYYDAMLVAEKHGYIAGIGDGRFAPNENITREQVCVILSKVMNLIDLPNTAVPKDKVSSWARPYVNKVLANRIMSLDKNGNFRSTKLATRADVADGISKFVDTRPKNSQIQAPAGIQKADTLAAKVGKLVTATNKIEVKDSSNLTKAEKEKIAKELLKANDKKNIKDFVIDNKGNVTEVIFKDGSSIKNPTELKSQNQIKETASAGGGGGGGGGGASTPSSISKSKAKDSAEGLIKNINRAKEKLSLTGNALNCADEMISEINKFISGGCDKNYNILDKMKSVKSKYSNILNAEEKDDLRSIYTFINTNYTAALIDYFGLNDDEKTELESFVN